ncbi:P-loop containing nucleoside triphosphate hydrolase protein [Rhizoclosmatium globosum]|uniref:p-loop containing nucleoside triphosphate hydrolase protein n=1 Tax=Rhizoclosmatium globosum TaxID=329046 RepID=A0A1Y2CI24_9FUNG|nr:P-loop containing nucleoside triphosphate hydrolase protein [Rhizoclosmatium globosum]|eukprot:ORY46474.1 P-loop containing nucleoside triphosphate hydrolase protein [Rhizoclosmatium globosum]
MLSAIESSVASVPLVKTKESSAGAVDQSVVGNVAAVAKTEIKDSAEQVSKEIAPSVTVIPGTKPVVASTETTKEVVKGKEAVAGDKKENVDDEDEDEEEETVTTKQTAKPVFKVVRRKDKAEDTEIVELQVNDQTIINSIQTVIRCEGLYASPPVIRSEELFTILPQLRAMIFSEDETVGEDEEVFCNDTGVNGKRGLVKLVQYLEKEHKEATVIINNMKALGKISFKYLWSLFPNDGYAVTEVHGEPQGLVVVKTSYLRTWIGNFFVIEGRSIDCDGTHFKYDNSKYYISDFDAVVDITSLNARPLETDSKLFNELAERGKLFEKYAIGNSIMVDALSFGQMNPNYNMGVASNRPAAGRGLNVINAENNRLTNVPDAMHFLCSPTVYAFSFASKRWGQTYVKHICPISFDDHAFQRLVMDHERKHLILNLVNGGTGCNLDLINGKGGGLIFLLHGCPGVGKTLTAESVAEHLHKPLYSVSAGELGTDVASLERKLSEILEVASAWSAVILIDEADIFLERRILFLTTNRVQCFDQAFKSRITLALRYGDLESSAREQIWKTFLDRSEGEGNWDLDVTELGKADINGREIKNVVRLAKAMATGSTNATGPITMENVRKVLLMMKTFDDEVGAETNFN